MDFFNLNNFLNRPDFLNKNRQFANEKNSDVNKIIEEKSGSNPPNTQNKQENPKPQNLNTLSRAQRNLQMNNLTSVDRANYIRNLLNLKPDLLALLKDLDQNFAQLLKISNAKDLINILLSYDIDISKFSTLFKENAKEAIQLLFKSLALASKQGIEATEIEKMVKYINASVSGLQDADSTQTLKTMMLLYLPWLPLPQGKGFDLEFEITEENKKQEQTVLVIMISTKNFGNIKATLVLLDKKELSIIIDCVSDFPQKDLVENLKKEAFFDPEKTLVSFNEISQIDFEKEENINKNSPAQNAKISLNKNNHINPCLMLFSQSLIKHIIEIDNNS